MKLIDTGYYRNKHVFKKGYMGACYHCGQVFEADEEILTVWVMTVNNQGLFVSAKLYKCPHCEKEIPFFAAEMAYNVSKEFSEIPHESI